MTRDPNLTKYRIVRGGGCGVRLPWRQYNMKRKMKKWKNKKRKQGGCLVRGIKMKYKRLIDCEISKQTNCTNKQTRTEKTICQVIIQVLQKILLTIRAKSQAI